MSTPPPLLRVSHLHKVFSSAHGMTHAVDGVSFTLQQGKTLAIIGESGSGKSTLGKMLVLLERPSQGEIFLEGENILTFSPPLLQAMRRQVQMVFQDPYSSLNPRMRVESILSEPFAIHKTLPKEKRKERIKELLEAVGLHEEYQARYPSELSGGQRQRIALARALALEPKLLICDEPLSALDVSTKAQMLTLLKELQKKKGIAYLFIAHDLALVKNIADEVLILYAGRQVEYSSASSLYQSPLHPYTQALFSAIPVPDPKVEKNRTRLLLKEPTTPKAGERERGCLFAPRCPYAKKMCHQLTPKWTPSTGHFVACHIYDPTVDYGEVPPPYSEM